MNYLKFLVTASMIFVNARPALATAVIPANKSLLEVLSEAEAVSPQTERERQLVMAAGQEVGIRQSKYYPSLTAAAITSTGNPGSFALMDVDSNISSTNRVGYGGALVAKQEIWDFGRTSHAVHSAEVEKKLVQGQAGLSRLEVDQDVVDTYLNCAFLKTQLENSSSIVQRIKIVAGEIDKFVRAGQRSIIERYLVDSEQKAAETRAAEFTERLRVTEVRLGILLAKKAMYKVSCHKLEDIGNDIAAMEKQDAQNPLLEIEKIKAEVAESRLAEARAEQMPDIYGMGMVGVFNNDHLADRQDYALGVGISFPLFSGFLIDSRIAKRRAELKAEQANADYSRQTIDKIHARYEEKINSLAVRLKFLEEEKTHAKKVFDLAHRRYESSQGNMTDLRDSIQNMNRISLSADETYRDLYLARAEKTLFDGFKPSDKNN